ncbi:MAG: hypothetical protein IPL84_14630 [Chitinophagaceae bacterium]|nr:hypothetical protein [Chitinophagaceae bacterium]
MKKMLTAFFAVLSLYYAQAQDSTSLLKDIGLKPDDYQVTGTFKSTRVINAHSTEMLPKGVLDVRIMHRFGVVKNGFKDLFGIDNASMRLSFDYGICDRLMIGIGRSTILKDLDIFAKARVLQQTSGGEKRMPVTLLLAAGYIVTTQESFANPKPDFGDRSSFFVQVIAGRKFSRNFSMQISPLLVHNNATLNPDDDKNIIGLGGGLRYKVSKRVALMLDYHYAIGVLDAAITNPLSFGVDIETGGHVFQLHISNATSMNEKGYLTQTTGEFFKGDIRIGFNLSRVFTIGKRKKKW